MRRSERFRTRGRRRRPAPPHLEVVRPEDSQPAVRRRIEIVPLGDPPAEPDAGPAVSNGSAPPPVVGLALPPVVGPGPQWIEQLDGAVVDHDLPAGPLPGPLARVDRDRVAELLEESRREAHVEPSQPAPALRLVGDDGPVPSLRPSTPWRVRDRRRTARADGLAARLVCPMCRTAARLDLTDRVTGRVHLSCDTCYRMWQDRVRVEDHDDPSTRPRR